MGGPWRPRVALEERARQGARCLVETQAGGSHSSNTGTIQQQTAELSKLHQHHEADSLPLTYSDAENITEP